MSGTREGLLIGSIFKCLVLQDLGKKLRLSPGDTVLDVGSGLGGFAFYLAKVLNTAMESNSMYRYVYNVCVGHGDLDFGRTLYGRVQVWLELRGVFAQDILIVTILPIRKAKEKLSKV